MIKHIIGLLFLAYSNVATPLAFSGVCDGLTDVTASWNADIAKLTASSTDKTLDIPAGNCVFRSRPVPLRLGVSIRGQGKSTTVLIRAYSAVNDGFITIYNQGSTIRDLTIFAAPGTHGGIGLYIESSDAAKGGNHEIQNVWVTGGGTWYIPMMAYGEISTTPPAGVRAILMNNVNLFNGTVWLLVWWDCIACEWIGGGAYQGAGSTSNIAVGGTRSEKNVINANISGAVTSSVDPASMRFYQP